jgi:hypothetical protein
LYDSKDSSNKQLIGCFSIPDSRRFPQIDIQISQIRSKNIG